ncbi:hypothetical protein, partial [Acetivibrio mesophilus]
ISFTCSFDNVDIKNLLLGYYFVILAKKESFHSLIHKIFNILDFISPCASLFDAYEQKMDKLKVI